MLTVRPVRWPDDEAAICAIDPSYTSDRIYGLYRQDLAFTLVDLPADPPFVKSDWMMADLLDELKRMKHVVVAEFDGEVAGLAAAAFSAWNRRVVLWHLYVQPACRGSGVGKALLASVDQYARSAGAWCVWLETQNVNYPAVQFYRRQGFALCGLDLSMFDSATTVGQREIPLFFSRPIEPAL